MTFLKQSFSQVFALILTSYCVWSVELGPQGVVIKPSVENIQEASKSSQFVLEKTNVSSSIINTEVSVL